MSNPSSNRADTLVIVEVYGVPNDHVKQQTRVIKKNGELLRYLTELLLDFLWESLHVNRVFNTFQLFIKHMFCVIFEINKMLSPADTIC